MITFDKPVAMTTAAVAELFKQISKESPKQDTVLVSNLYRLADEREDAIKDIARKSEHIQDALAEIAEGRHPTYNIGQMSVEIEQAIQAKKSAEKQFVSLANMFDFAVEK